jgi:hypothetical protein
MSGFEQDISLPTRLYSDSQGSIALAKNPQEHEHTKHIDKCHHFIHEHVTERTVTLEYITSQSMASDVMTKALSKNRHDAAIGMIDINAV